LSETFNPSWLGNLPVRSLISDSILATQSVADKTILLTGAGGCIGAALAGAILRAKPRCLILLDHSEHALYELVRSLSAPEGPHRFRPVPGDVGDPRLLASILEEHRPDLILHAAAYKHVPLMEANPFAAVQNNTILTWQLAKAAAEAGVPQLLVISTDKAANPRSILGASKRIAELAAVRYRYSAVRLVNVFGSTGSVVPLLLDQIAKGGPLTITHPDATRYFMTIEDTVRLILIASSLAGVGVFIPDLPEPLRILDLANQMLRHSTNPKNIAIEFSGLRPGDKLTEDILAPGESLEPTSHPAIQLATAPFISYEHFDNSLHQLSDVVQRRDLPALLETLCQLVPEYQSSRALCPAAQAAHD
jgi:FlaA1/EpsC-like NDP-sugar epimerase